MFAFHDKPLEPRPSKSVISHIVTYWIRVNQLDNAFQSFRNDAVNTIQKLYCDDYSFTIFGREGSITWDIGLMSNNNDNNASNNIRHQQSNANSIVAIKRSAETQKFSIDNCTIIFDSIE